MKFSNSALMATNREVHVPRFSWSESDMLRIYPKYIPAHEVWPKTGRPMFYVGECTNHTDLLYCFYPCGILPMRDGAGLIEITVVPSSLFHSWDFGLRLWALGWFSYVGFRVSGFETTHKLMRTSSFTLNGCVNFITFIFIYSGNIAVFGSTKIWQMMIVLR